MHFWGGKPSKSAEFYADYQKFYIDNLLEEVKDSMVDISKNFMDTSPSNGVESFDPYTIRFVGHDP